MKSRVTLKLEALDNRIVPGSNSIRYGQETNQTGGMAMLGDNTDKYGQETNLLRGAVGTTATGGVELLGGSKPTGAIGDKYTGIELFGTGYKPGTTGGQGAADKVELFGSKPGLLSGGPGY